MVASKSRGVVLSDLLDFVMVRHTAGYRLVVGGPRASDILLGPASLLPFKGTVFIEPAGKTTETYRPFEVGTALFKTVAGLKKSPNSVLKFVNKYGLLCKPNGIPQRARDNIEDWYELIDYLKAAIKAWKAGDVSSLSVNVYGDVMVQISSQDDGSPAIKMQPRDFRSALLIQFARAATADAELKCCEQCGTWFAVGTGTGRRSTAQFCSDACRKENWRAKGGKS